MSYRKAFGLHSVGEGENLFSSFKSDLNRARPQILGLGDYSGGSGKIKLEGKEPRGQGDSYEATA